MGRRYFGEQKPTTRWEIFFSILLVLFILVLFFLMAMAPFILLAKTGGW